MIIGRRPHPVIGKLAGSWGSGRNSSSATSPRSPLEITNIHSPKTPKKYDFVGGIGLGIVAALENSKHNPNKPIVTRNRSMSNEKDYTFVACHGPNKNVSTSTRAYSIGFDWTTAKKHGRVVFDISPTRSSDDVPDVPDSDFLSVCHLCRKTLHGKDIYMYRGETAFCSAECRYVEIVKDERNEKQKCSSKFDASRSDTADRVSTDSPYTASRPIFATGILAT